MGCVFIHHHTAPSGEERWGNPMRRDGLSWGNIRPREQRSLLRVALCYIAYQTRNETHLVWSGCWFPCRDSNVKDSLQTLSSNIVPWCIGCTGVFDTLRPGPNPGGTTRVSMPKSLFGRRPFGGESACVHQAECGLGRQVHISS